ncbi:hypothetical protein DXG03_003152 [Asterophora parasitica]|uniref:Uncharacterized protein n=1 Tax=Asterophora parasitica TaxID=117018 RepID=A0A9P7KIA3_9AGAR|nr:hypothetical protein DXG03_003152 [Asterophora parasitica]
MPSFREREFGETVEWRHWGCVTPAILNQLAALSVDRITGFQNLTLEDQQKIKLAASLRRIDSGDIPESAKARPAPTPSASSERPSQRKRKAEQDRLLAYQGTPSSSPLTATLPSAPGHLTLPTATQIAEDEQIEEAPTEEAKDELYCTMHTNVVGIQYYKGILSIIWPVGFLIPFKDWWDPGKKSSFRESHTTNMTSMFSSTSSSIIHELKLGFRNAIQVKNIGQTQVGHLPAKLAVKLAPLLDQHLVTVEGVINDGNLGGGKVYTLSISLRIYGDSDMRDTLEPRLIFATPGQRGFPPRASASASASTSHQPTVAPSTNNRSGASAYGTRPRSGPAQTAVQQEALRKHQEALHKQEEALQKAAELRQMLSSLEKVDDEGRRSSLLDTLCSTDDILNLPLHPNPPGTKNGELKVDLLKHQSQALQWCVERENPILPKKDSDKPVQFWQIKKNDTKTFYYNGKDTASALNKPAENAFPVATKTPQETPPLLGRGALCADAMGLGKTLTMLALILATKKDVPRDYSNTTLIVAPLSILSNWEKQVADHCITGSLSACIYYDATRSMSAERLATFDLVITTYQTVVGEFADGTRGAPVKKKKKLERSLFDMQWKRVILDEGHTIRNPKTKMAKAVCALSAQRRWVLTGTPIINSPRDLGSVLTFLQICRPLDNEDFYKRLLLRPLKDGAASGVELLRALMSQICIRRTKEMQDSDGNALIPLPPVEMTIVPVTLSDEARVLYDEVENLSKERFENFMNRGTGSVVQSNVLSMLTRMRQLALHPGLVPPNYLEELRKMGEDDAAHHQVTKLSPVEISRLRGLLGRALEDFEECPICFCVLNDARITNCGHMFCLPCITEVISRDPKCPMDRRPIAMGDLYEPPPPTDMTQAPVRREEDLDSTGIRGGSSAKIDQLVQLLRLTPGTEKSLVFSQFTSFLDKIAETLEAEGIPYVRFDGQMSARRRQETIARFSVPIADDASIQESSANVNCDDEDDYVMSDNEDDDFIDDEDDDCAFSGKKKRGRKTKSKGKGRASYSGPSYAGENPKVMLLSLKAGAVGLNLTVANNVYLMDPWWQEGIESQAVDRVNRIGQKKPVHVYQMIAENTVESKVLEIQERKKQLIQQIQLDSPRIRLVPPSSDDDEAVSLLRSHPETLRYLKFLPKNVSVEDARIRRETRAEDPHIVDFHIHVKNDGGSYTLGGMTGLFHVDETNESCEVGILVSPHLHRGGLGTEALYNVLKYAFDERKLHRVTFETAEENAPMCSWLEKVLEAKLEARRRDCWKEGDGKYTSVNGYSLLAWEWSGGIREKLEKLVVRHTAPQ